jgi:hypothetical protein
VLSTISEGRKFNFPDALTSARPQLKYRNVFFTSARKLHISSLGRFAMKKLRGKLIMAAVILSCGIAMQADPPSRAHRSQKVAAAHATERWQMLHAAEAAPRSAALKHLPPHGQQLP